MAKFKVDSTATTDESLPMLGDEITLIFRENRTFTLCLDNIVYVFLGREPKKFKREILTHKDFGENMRKYFLIQGE